MCCKFIVLMFLCFYVYSFKVNVKVNINIYFVL